MPAPIAHNAAHTYVHLGTGPEVGLEPVTDTFWAEIGDRADLQQGRLVTSMIASSSWKTWEMHPVGAEIIFVTAGLLSFTLDDGDTQWGVQVEAPEYIVVPPKVWHTMDVIMPGRLLIITWGEGTDHRPR